VPRHLVLGNGRLLVNFDDRLAMRDLYYPRVGMANHILGHQNRLGLWVDGSFCWLGGGEWSRWTGYEEEALVGRSTALSEALGIRLAIVDAVHFREDLYLKEVEVSNLRPYDREVRLFFTHDFSMWESDIGDTAMYDPGADAIVHYKRDLCLLASGIAGERGIFQYATGTKRFGGVEGTWRDAEDGWLEGNPIAQGSVDSAFSLQLLVPAQGSRKAHYWIAAGRRFEEARRVHRLVRRIGVPELVGQTRAYWKAWLRKAPRDFKDLPEECVRLFHRSLLVVRTQIDRSGAITAANDSDILHFNRDHYSYVWPRDGALVAYAMAKAGYPELVRDFYLFCRRGLSPGGYLWHKYHPDGSVGSSWHPLLSESGPQLPIQEDETALVLFALWHHYQVERDLDFVEGLYATLIKPAADFLCSYRDPATGLPLESYDLWEERRGVFTFTAAAVWAGLRAARRFARLFGDWDAYHKYKLAAKELKQAILTHLWNDASGRFARGLVRRGDQRVLDMTLESSLYGVHAFGLLPADDPRVRSTIEQVAEGLAVRTEVGGLARYSGDAYFGRGHQDGIPGNPWIICTLWLAEWYIARARWREDLVPARQLLEWAARRALPSGILPEQLDPWSGSPLSVAPLTWSHSTYVLAVAKYLEAMGEIEAKEELAQAWHTGS